MSENEASGSMLIETPGQDLTEVVERMPAKDIATILGTDLVAVINVLPGISDRVKV